MNWDDIERELANQSNKESHAVNTEEMWQNVFPHIPKEKKRNRFFFIWFLGGACLLGLLMGKNAISKSDDNPLAIANIDSIERLETLVDQYNEVSNANEVTQLNTAEKKGIKEVSKIAATTLNLIERKANTTEHVQLVLTPLNSKSRELSANNNGGTIKRILATGDNSFGASNQTVSTPAQAMSPEQDQTKATHNNDNSLEKALMLAQPSLLELLIIKELQYTSTYMPTPLSAPMSVVEYKRDMRISLYSEIAGGVALGHGQLGLRSQDWIDSYLFQSNAESSLPSFSGRINVGLSLNDKWSFQTGVIFQQLYKRSVSQLNMSQDISVDDAVIQQIIDTNGSKFITGSAIVQEITTSDVRRISHISTIEIPLEVLYTYRTNKIQWDLGFGISYGISQRRSGLIHPNENTEYDTANDELNWFNKNSLWASQASMGVRVPISNRIDILSRGKYKYYLSDATVPSYGISENLSHWQFEFGARFNF